MNLLFKFVKIYIAIYSFIPKTWTNGKQQNVLYGIKLITWKSQQKK